MSHGLTWEERHKRECIRNEMLLTERLIKGILICRALRALDMARMRIDMLAFQDAVVLQGQRLSEITIILHNEMQERERLWQKIFLLVYEPCWQRWQQRVGREAERENAARLKMHRDFLRVMHSLEDVHPKGHDPPSKYKATHLMADSRIRGNSMAALSLGVAAANSHASFRGQGLELKKKGCWLPPAGFTPQVANRVESEETMARRKRVLVPEQTRRDQIQRMGRVHRADALRRQIARVDAEERALLAACAREVTQLGVKEESGRGTVVRMEDKSRVHVIRHMETIKPREKPHRRSLTAPGAYGDWSKDTGGDGLGVSLGSRAASHNPPKHNLPKHAKTGIVVKKKPDWFAK